ncbi:hypothetical protein L1887_55217 [Cichorium endivia]|nr:hypothetical protein L1887_55217 [Cichorium endivia]
MQTAITAPLWTDILFKKIASARDGCIDASALAAKRRLRRLVDSTRSSDFADDASGALDVALAQPYYVDTAVRSQVRRLQLQQHSDRLEGNLCACSASQGMLYSHTSIQPQYRRGVQSSPALYPRPGSRPDRRWRCFDRRGSKLHDLISALQQRLLDLPREDHTIPSRPQNQDGDPPLAKRRRLLDLDTDNAQFEARAQADSSIPEYSSRPGTFVYGPGRPRLASSRKAFRRSSFRSECRLASRAAFLPSVLVFGRAPHVGGRSSKSSPRRGRCQLRTPRLGPGHDALGRLSQTLPLGHVSDTGSEAQPKELFERASACALHGPARSGKPVSCPFARLLLARIRLYIATATARLARLCTASNAGRRHHECHKEVWAAPPICRPIRTRTAAGLQTADSTEQSNDADARAESSVTDTLMSNTSDVDVFGTDEVVASQVRSAAFRSVLGPGDLLYLPPGWWHSLRSLTRSASVSTWF